MLLTGDFEDVHKKGHSRLEKVVTKNGTVTIEGVRYRIGEGLEHKDKAVIQVNKDLALIYRTTERGNVPIQLLYLEQNLAEKHTAETLVDLGEKGTKTSGLGLEEHFPKREDENVSEYQLRLELLGKDILSGVDIASEMAIAADQSIYEFDYEEVLAIASIINQQNPNKSPVVESENTASMVGFAKKYGREGIRALLVSEYNCDLATQLLRGEFKVAPEELQ
jgi:hypothetical protein